MYHYYVRLFHFPWRFFKMSIFSESKKKILWLFPVVEEFFPDHFLTCGDSVISTLVAKSGNKLTLLQVGILNLYMSYHTLLIQAEYKHRQQYICNSNLTEWSTMQGVIVRIHNLKLVESEVRGQFEIMSTITSWIAQHEVQLISN